MKDFDKIKRIGPYFKPYYGILFTDLLCAGLTTVSEIVLPLILRHITNLATRDLGLISLSLIFSSAGLFLLIKIIELVASYYMTSIGHIMGASIEKDMRKDIYAHLQGMSTSFYNDTKVGQIMSRITNDLFDITEFAHHCPEEYFIGLLKILISFIILASINLPLTLILYATIPLMAITANGFRKRMFRAQRDQRKHMGNLNARIEDSLAGIRVTKSFANEEIEEDKFNKENERFLSIKMDFYKSMAGFNTVTRLFDGLMYLIVIIGGGLFLQRGYIHPGDMIAYIMFVSTMIATVRRIIEFTEIFQKGMTGIERFHEIMETQSEIKERQNPIDLSNVRGDIDFKGVTFSYGERGEEVLKDFNLSIKAGENIALVGPSGSGKTTLCNLIPRFYDLDKGKIEIDGKDIKDLSLSSLRGQIGMVQQDVYLFSSDIMENIRYGKPWASDEEVVEAAKAANALEFICALDKGFKTNVGEKGVKLSGGQKQRISIARVFLKNPPILILDEATSALDNESERIIQESLEELSKGRTTVTIAHRLSTVEGANRILVMEKGRGIVEEGSHSQLLERKGFYYNLYTKGVDLGQL